jgi:hypothetical protein
VTTAVLNLVDHPWPLLGVLFVLLVVVVELGHRLRLANTDEQLRKPLVGARDSISLLLSLLLGFTLAMALPRYEDRKKLIIDEANAIGTTALRARLLPEPARSTTLRLLSDYVDARVEFSAAPLNGQQLHNSLVRTKQLQEALWQQSVAAAEQNPTPLTAIFVQSLNESIDLTEKRLATFENRIPNAIWILLVLISILSCLTTG